MPSRVSTIAFQGPRCPRPQIQAERARVPILAMNPPIAEREASLKANEVIRYSSCLTKSTIAGWRTY